MATALLRCLFRNLMFYHVSGESLHVSERASLGTARAGA